MCGIAGEFTFDGRPVSSADVQLMTDALVHRGPDAAGMHCEGPIGLGHRRLAIIDLSDEGRQPIWSVTGRLAIVYNGELYNYRELRAVLEAAGWAFRTATDTEVLLHAIEHWGLEHALSRFIGMFAFAVWDDRDRILTLCRDRTGIKPLYYSLDPRRLLFASELKGLMAHPAFGRRVDQNALAQTLVTGYTIGEATPFLGCRRVLAGHYVRVTPSGTITSTRYWGLEHLERGSFRGSYNDAVDGLLELCDSAFAYRLVADVPVGLFQSAGVDSTLVAAILRKRLGVDVLSITMGFSDGEYDESEHARQITQTLGVRHEIAYVALSEVSDALDRFVDIFDEPFGDTSGIPTFLLSRAARRHVKVALSADGGDEQFCGYESYGAYANRAKVVSGVPLPARRLLASLLDRWLPLRALASMRSDGASGARYLPQGVARHEKMLRVLSAPTVADVMQSMHEFAFRSTEVKRLLPGASGDPLAGTGLSREALAHQRSGWLDAMMRTDYTTYLADDILTKVDRASMAASLECRDPLLDHRLAEFAFQLPVEFLYNRRSHKRILRTLCAPWVGPRVLNRPKRGFVIPLYYWLRGVWKPRVLDTLAPGPVKRIGLLDPVAVSDEVRRFYSNEGCRAEKVWILFNLQSWAERWLVTK